MPMNASRENIERVGDRRQLSENKRELIRKVIIDQFSDALFQDVGIRDICAAAGVTPKTVYKHFGNKDRLLISAIGPDMEHLNELFAQAAAEPGSAPHRLEAIGLSFMTFYFSRLPVARILFLNIPSAYLVSHPAFIQRAQLDVLQNVILDGQAEGSIRCDVDAQDLSEAMAGISMRSMFRYLTSPTPLPEPEVAAAQLARLTRPLLEQRQDQNR